MQQLCALLHDGEVSSKQGVCAAMNIQVSTTPQLCAGVGGQQRVQSCPTDGGVSVPLPSNCCVLRSLTKHVVKANLAQAGHQLADGHLARSQAHGLSNGYTHRRRDLSNHHLPILLGSCRQAARSTRHTTPTWATLAYTHSDARQLLHGLWQTPPNACSSTGSLAGISTPTCTPPHSSSTHQWRPGPAASAVQPWRRVQPRLRQLQHAGTQTGAGLQAGETGRAVTASVYEGAKAGTSRAA